MTIHSDFTLFLSKEGDSVKIKGRKDFAIPEQQEATDCKTHEQVLAFLQKIQSSEIKNTLSFYHINNTRYDAHFGTSPQGLAHECPLDKQIRFVKSKIFERDDVSRRRPAPNTGCVLL